MCQRWGALVFSFLGVIVVCDVVALEQGFVDGLFEVLKSVGSSSKNWALAWVTAEAAPTAGIANPAASTPPAPESRTKASSIAMTLVGERVAPCVEEDMGSDYVPPVRAHSGAGLLPTWDRAGTWVWEARPRCTGRHSRPGRPVGVPCAALRGGTRGFG